MSLFVFQFSSIYMAEEFQTRRHDTNALESVSIYSAVSVTLSVKPPISQILQQKR